jgi:hypothetical protein
MGKKPVEVESFPRMVVQGGRLVPHRIFSFFEHGKVFYRAFMNAFEPIKNNGLHDL